MNDSNSNNNLFGSSGNTNNIPSQPNEVPVSNNASGITYTSNVNNSTVNTNESSSSNLNTLQTNQNVLESQEQQTSISVNEANTTNQQNLNSVNGINTINQQSLNTVNLASNSSNSEQSTNLVNQNVNNNNSSIQSIANNSNQIDNDELLQAFIGDNYEKITTKKFNFAGFFFTFFYMFYRKMFIHALIVFLINLVIVNFTNNFLVTFVYYFVIGLLVNKLYLSYANDKIAKIKINNTEKNIDELKKICSVKGGTSVLNVISGFVVVILVAFVTLIAMALFGIGGFVSDLFKLDEWNISLNGNDKDNSSSKEKGTLVEDVVSNGYLCYGSKCTITIETPDGSTDYTIKDDSELFRSLSDYKDYIKVNIYYEQKEEEKTIISYKIFLKSNNKEISNVKSEDELREKIGLYSTGEHTDTLTLSEIGSTGYGFEDDESFTYTSYKFVSNKNIEYEMKYKNPKDNLNLVEGKKYKVTFEVTEGFMEYEYNIKSIE